MTYDTNHSRPTLHLQGTPIKNDPLVQMITAFPRPTHAATRHLLAMMSLPSMFGFNPDRKRTLISLDQAPHITVLLATSSLLSARSSHPSLVWNMLSRRHPRTCVPSSCPSSCLCRHCPLPSARPSFVRNDNLRLLNITLKSSFPCSPLC